MHAFNKREYFICFLGDIFFFAFSLWAALSLRYLSFPSREFFLRHLFPFSLLFAIWIFVFYIAGLYDKQTVIFRKKLPAKILNALVANSVIGIFFFYFFPYADITPKTNLLVYLIVSFFLIYLWRLATLSLFKPRRTQRVAILADNPEAEELRSEIDNNPKYGFRVVLFLDPSKMDESEIAERIRSKNVMSVIADFQDPEIEPLVPALYSLAFSGISFFDIARLYEDVFDRVPLTFLGHKWMLENLSFHSHPAYDVLKRLFDMGVSFFLATLSLFLYLPVWLAIKIEDRGPAFVIQERIGLKGKTIRIVKFRSMNTDDKGVWVRGKDDRITKVGSFLRKTRIDEIPQLLNVMKGDLSLIGPRPDICGLGNDLKKEIPYYTIRNIVRPGLSGWAQVNQETPPQSLQETKKRLSYDLYYIKNRSMFLDLKIALKTINILLSRKGV